MFKKYDEVELISGKEYHVGKRGYIIGMENDEYIVKFKFGTLTVKESSLKNLTDKCYYMIEICSPTPNESYRINKLVVSDVPLTRGEILAQADCLFEDVTKIEVMSR